MNLIPILGACAIVGACALAWLSLTHRPSKAHANLFAGLPQADAAEAQSPTVTQRVGTSVGRFAPASWMSKTDMKLVQAGRPYGLDAPRLLGIKAIGTASMVLLWLLVGQPLLAVIFGALAFVIPDALIAGKRNERQEAMRTAAADLVDQLTICVEAGLGFDAALEPRRVDEPRPAGGGAARATGDMRAGMPRDQALRAMAERCQVPRSRRSWCR